MEVSYQCEVLFNSLYDELHPGGQYRDWSKRIYQLADYPKVKQMSDLNRLNFAFYCLEEIAAYYRHLPYFEDEFRAINHHNVSPQNFRKLCFAVELLQQVFRSKFSLAEKEIEFILTTCNQTMADMVHQSNMTEDWAYNQLLTNFPVSFLFRQIDCLDKMRGLSERFKKALTQSVFWKKIPYYKHNSQVVGIITSTLQRLFSSATQEDQLIAVFASEDDAFGQRINQLVDQSAPAQRSILYELLAHYKKATAGKPSGKFIDGARKLYVQLGPSETYISVVKQWLTGFKQTDVRSQEHTYAQYTYTSYSFLQETNAIMAKGIVWSLIGLVEQDPELIKLLAEVAEKSYQKIPGQGPAAAGVGNACLYVLAQSGLAGVGQLSRLKVRVKQANTQGLIEKYIQEASIRLNVSPQIIEDMAVADHGLTAGKLTQFIGNYQVEVTITGIGKIDLNWFKADGTLLKSEPASIKKEFAAELRTLKSVAADISKNITAQRDRLDRAMLLDRSWTWQAFTDYYAEHGLMSFIAQRLIWTVEKDDRRADMFCQNGVWADLSGNAIDWLDTKPTVRLWHPIGKSVDTIISWREFLTRHEIRQPLKQAFREVYLLTDAELNTRLYSNRMAAHILKQHQFNTLAKGRGWQYSLLGAYDKGYDSEKARIILPAHDIKAEFWVSEVDADGAWNDTGIYLYVSTDQVRFTRLADDNPLPLLDIPPLVFSEIMRDVDLFVGVASVGNDPNWRDGGLAQFRTYWESYSFGELGELAKSRKQVIERLIPRLKIAQVAEVRGNFLIVQGKLRTYKIHLGSGNILMEPNDQYLCIVPDRKANKGETGIFLPFEGDATLSIVLSKAFLLADDDKITDETITRQIGRKRMFI